MDYVGPAWGEIGATVLVLIGYLLAVPVVFRMRAVFGERRTRWYAVFQVGMGMLVVGHLAAGRPVAAGLNLAGALLVAYAWWRTGRRSTTAEG